MHKWYQHSAYFPPLRWLSGLLFLLLLQGNFAIGTEKEPAHENTLEKFYPEEFLPIVKQVCADNPEKALKLSRKQQKSSQSRQDSLYAFFKGLSYLRLKQYDKAAAELHRSWTARKSSSDTLYFLGIALFQIGQQEQALQFLKEAAWFSRYTIVPPETIYERIGIIANSKEDYPTAISFFEKSISSNPDYLPSRIKLASLYEITEEHDRAKAQMEIIQKRLAEPKDEKESESSACSIEAIRKLLLGTERSPIDIKILNARYALSQLVSANSKTLTQKTIRDLAALLKLEEISDQQRVETLALLTRAYLIDSNLEGAKSSLAELRELSAYHPSIEPLSIALETETAAVEQIRLDTEALQGEGQPQEIE